MAQIDKFYYINLDRAPDRKEHFLKEAQRENIPIEKIERYPAIDGKAYQFSSEEESWFNQCNYSRSPFKEAIMGNQLSHFNILKDIVKNKYKYACIFQDDVRFKSGFMSELDLLVSELPSDTEIVWIGLHLYGCLEKFIPWPIELPPEQYPKKAYSEKVTEHIYKYSKGTNPCSLAYLVTLRGAENLVDYFNIVGFHKATDGNFNDYLEAKDLTYTSRPVLCTGNEKFPSSIFSK